MPDRIVLVCAAALLIGACTQPEEPIRIGVLLWPPYELAHLAEAEGLMPPGRIRLIDYQTPAEVVRAYRNGLIDGLFLTTQYALSDYPDRPGTRIIYAINESKGGDSLLTRPGLDSFEDLKGKTVALEAGPLGAYILQRVLDLSKLERGDLKLRFIDTPGHVDAYTSGEVDAVITYEPFRSHVLEAGATELFSSRDIPGEIIDVLYVSGQLLENRSEDLVQFIRALDEARRLLETRPEQALPVMAQRHQMAPEAFAGALAGASLFNLEENMKLLGGERPVLAEKTRSQFEVFRRAGMQQSESMDFAEPDARIVRKVMP
ncbi:ABC transporter substrate-binding protein [Wenzhouxiangella sp. XN201]|uniref:ABC transporter substrate-binding protein n=1 Tax=Wenzhouxiangella sp. XN201 TaxID=2710755 RepID=UPI0013C82B4D|nr:ABC transporter substrate-binding protein [Wenzhouxiangella sp. XN201]NEZ05077.1 ABC transporter substrate-binding protein [Wenzhouxiangella sp. XN201]